MRVYQINEQNENPGFVGAFVLAEEEKTWGIKGFIHNVIDKEECNQIPLRLKWREVDYIGTAELIPGDDNG